jgi:predicted AAA+ superfamily ATPase
VTGARQSGKTTLLRHEFGKSHGFVSLERPDIRARAKADPVAFLAEHPAPLVLDEIQYAPALLHYLKEKIDVERKPGHWILSGSQSFPLMQGVAQSLAGRVAVLSLDPLSVGEALGAAAAPTLDAVLSRVFGSGPLPSSGDLTLGDWLLRGGYPEPRLDPDVDRALWFASYVQTYLERDVRDLLQVGDLDAFGRFLSLAAARTGALLNMSDLGRDAGVTGPTARRWISVLEASHVVFLLPPFHENFGKRIIKSPRLYFADPGLASFLLGLHTSEAILSGPSAGALAETAVISEWWKAFRQRGERPALFFWSTGTGAEVDLLIERNGHLHAIEVKSTATPTPHHAESLARFLEIAKKKGRRTARAVLACRVEKPFTLRPGIRAVPWSVPG